MSATSRRSFLLGLGAALAAPAIVRAELLMPVRKVAELPRVLLAPETAWVAAQYDVYAEVWKMTSEWSGKLITITSEDLVSFERVRVSL